MGSQVEWGIPGGVNFCRSLESGLRGGGGGGGAQENKSPDFRCPEVGISELIFVM